jgi:hypothetical protein
MVCGLSYSQPDGEKLVLHLAGRKETLGDAVLPTFCREGEILHSAEWGITGGA